MQESQPEERIEGRIKEGEFREWYFPRGEVLEWTKKFMQYADYEILPTSYIGFVQPDFHARKQTEKATYEVVGMVCQHVDVALDGLVKLAAMKTVLEERADYVLVLPPISEYLLVDFLSFDEGRWYLEMRRQRFMMWLGNPDEEFVWCLTGGPGDKALEEFFALGLKGLDFLFGQKFMQQRWEAEEEE